MIEQQKILRIFKLINMLERGQTLANICEKLACTERTCFRYFALLRELGLELELENGRYKLLRSELDVLADLSLEEHGLVSALVSALPQAHPLKGAILGKLNIKNPNGVLVEQYYKLKTALLIEKLVEAIEHSKQVRLVQYQSAHSGTVSDRLVEPKKLSSDFVTLHAIELKTQELKHFKIDRLGGVEVLPSKQKSGVFVEQAVDAFGMTGEETHVCFSMNLRSKLLLEEEFPRVYQHLKKVNDRYVFDGPVRHYKGVARFVLSLLDEVEVLEPQEFKNYLNAKVKERGF